jgi:NAD-dependent SIR2 family protein deacetylase/tetratricopeptide (TPR) repeat protein
MFLQWSPASGGPDEIGGTMADAMRKLAKRMRMRSRTIAFVGAGASASVGYPTWDQLIDGLYQEATSTRGINRAESDQDLRWVAEQFDSDLEGSLVDSVRRVFEERAPGGPGPLHTMLARLPFNHFITTNYDRLIEQACDEEARGAARWVTGSSNEPQFTVEPCIPRSGRDPEQFSGFLSLMAEDSPRRAVLHLHGTLEDQLTLTMADYNRQYLHDATLLRMFAIFATSTVVFVGASLRDPDVMELVRRAHFHSGPKARHFAFLPESRRSEAALLERNYGIQSIFYTYDNLEGHQDAVRRLEQLLELVEETDADPTLLKPNGNFPSTKTWLAEGQSPQFEKLVDGVKDQVRRRRRGLATFSGLDAVTSSRILRRIATDYSRLPKNHHFRNVVWLSPANLGSFPGAGSRTLVDALVGEMTSALGSYRLTAGHDHDHNFRAIESLLQSKDDFGPESALIVIDAIADLREACSPDELTLFRWFLANLPQGTVALLSQAADTDPFDDEMDWEGLKSHMSFDSQANGSSTVDSDSSRLDKNVLEVLERDDITQRVLLATCVLATPVDSGALPVMLDLPPGKVEEALAELAELGLLEMERLLDPPRPDAGRRARERIPEGGLGEIGISSPIRRAALGVSQELFGAPRDTDSGDALIEVVWRLASWSRSVIASLDRWEAEKDQFQELIGQVADLLGAFEASCWLVRIHSKDMSRLDEKFLDTWLWLGADLAYILPYAGRWAEAKRIILYLKEFIDLADQPRVFRRELAIQESRIVVGLALTDVDVGQAADLARAAVDTAVEDLAPVDAKSSVDDRTAIELHLAQARIRLGQALILQKKDEEARDQFATIYEGAFFDESNRPTGRLLKYAADAAGFLAHVMRRNLSSSPSELEIAEILRVLDDGFTALIELSNRRDRGYQAVLRGEVLLQHGNVRAARRSLARALIISHEFQDRYLEARALLGLAQTDRRRALAEKSASIFADIDPESQREAREAWYELPAVEPNPFEDRTNQPSIVVFIGVPGTGKTAAFRTAKMALTAWGLKPQVVGIDPLLIERLRQGEDLGMEEIHDRLESTVEEVRKIPSGVAMASLPLSHPAELFQGRIEHDPLMSEILCIDVQAPQEVLEARNRERHAEGVAYSTLAGFVTKQSSEPIPSPHATWESWVEIRGGAYVQVVSDVPIRDFQASVRDLLGLSFLGVEPLLSAKR